MKFLLKEDKPFYFVRSDQDAPTIYFTLLGQFAAPMKEKGKGIVFLGENFCLGLMGNKTLFDYKIIEEICKSMSKKEVKSNVKDSISFDFKVKGQKPVVTKDIL